MALSKQIISIPMSLGIDTENAPPLVDNNRFGMLSNVVFNKDNNGQLHKRSGHVALSRSNQAGGTIPAIELLALFGDELDAIAGGALYGYSPQNQTWAVRGAPPLIQQSEASIAAGAYSVSNPDACSIGGLGFYVYEMNGASWVKVIDESNKSIRASIKLVSGSGALYSPKILSAGTFALIVATDNTGSIWFAGINATTLAVSYQNTTILLDAGSGNETCFDAAIISGVLYVAGIGRSALKGISYNATSFPLAFIATPPGGNIASPVVAPSPVSVTAVGSILYVTWQNPGATGFVVFQEVTASTWTFGTSGDVSPSAIAPCPRITTGSITVSGVPTFVAFYETAPSGTNILSTISYYISGTVIVWSTGTSLAGQPFEISPNVYLPAVYQSEIQQTLFLTFQAVTGTPANALAQVAGRYYSENDAGNPPGNFRIAAPINITGTTASLPVMVQPHGASASSVAASLAELSLSFSTAAQFSQLGGNLHLACGSQLMDYDGTNLVEHNFHVYPEAPTISYLTSQLTVITDGFDPNFQAPGGGMVQGSYRIMVPDNAASPGGPVGQLIRAGEYITFFPDISPPASGLNPFVIYFTVDGVGTAPTGLGAGIGAGACAIQSSMTAIQVAQAIFDTLIATDVVNAYYHYHFSPAAQTNSATPQTVVLTTSGITATEAAAPPVLSTASDAKQVYVGTYNTVPATIGLAFPGAQLIGTGQYCQFTSSATFFTGNKAIIYVWFSNPSNPTVGNEVMAGGDPEPFGHLANGPTAIGAGPTAVCTWSNPTGPGNYIGVRVDLVGSETPVAVAALASQAINAVRTSTTPSFGLGVSTFSSTQQANTVAIQYGLFAAGQIVASDFPSTNVGRGYVGAVIDNSSQPFAAIEYSSVYEWIDSQNQLHQSAPSVPAIAYIPTYITTTATVANNIITTGSAVPVSAVIQISTRPVSLTGKTAAITGTDLDIAIYRTISGATVGNQVFYRITPTTGLLFNQPSSTSAISYADFSNDGESAASSAIGAVATGVQANQLLYTTGGVQPNAAPPACSYVINHQNRLWLSGLENPSELWYSETFDQTAGQAVNFTQLQYALVNPIVGQTSGGPIVALASMDSNLIVFQKNQIWYIQGSGPDATGGNGFFTPPQIVASSSQIGCRDVNSVVLMPNGIMFKSTQGFWLLGRDLQLRYIGAAVKTYNADVVTSAVALASNSQINFLSNSGTTLMYDWYYDSWSTFTTQGLDSLLDPSGTFTIVTSSGSVWSQNEGSYIDGDGSAVVMSIRTSWLKPGNVQGFQRIWKAFFEGQFLGSQPYQIQIAYNYDPTIVDTFILFPGAGSAASNVWGGSPTWGDSPVWGEDGSSGVIYPDQIQIRVYPSNQLCEAIQFTITDMTPVPMNETWSLNALDLEIGIRVGGFKRIGNPQSLG